MMTSPVTCQCGNYYEVRQYGRGFSYLTQRAIDDWYTQLPILATSLIHFSLKGWENVLFELESERVTPPGSSIVLADLNISFVFLVEKLVSAGFRLLFTPAFNAACMHSNIPVGTSLWESCNFRLTRGISYSILNSKKDSTIAGGRSESPNFLGYFATEWLITSRSIAQSFIVNNVGIITARNSESGPID